MYSNQFTLAEVTENALNEHIDTDDELYMQGDSWGSETVIGSMADWENEIPADEDVAELTGWYDWYVSDEHYDKITWEEYRDYLLSQLISIEIVEEED